MRHLFKYIFYVSVLIVFFLSIVNASDIEMFARLSFLSDKAVHGLIYFYLTFIGLLSKFKIKDISIASLIFLFGFIIEIIHYFHPYRYFEYFDLLANLIGVTIALLIFKLKNIY